LKSREARARRAAAWGGILLAAALASLPACKTSSGTAPGVDLRTANPDYFQLLERRINRNWGPTRGGPDAVNDLASRYARSGGGIVVVSFSIGSNGELLGTPAVEESSGSPFLDQEALRAVKLAAPFPPLPESLGTNRVDLLWRFEHLATGAVE
jgi:TonB family protein